MERRLAAILSADMVGYSRLMADDETATLERQKELRVKVFVPEIRSHGGRLVKTTGDGLLAEFPSVVDALRCGVTIQLEIARRNETLPGPRRTLYRMGLNLGDIVSDAGDIYGDGVNIAARLEQLADPGGICVSGTVAEQARGKIASGLEDMGRQTLKNIPDPVHVYRIDMRPEKPGAERPAQRSARPAMLALAAMVLVLLAGTAVFWKPWAAGPATEPAQPPVQAAGTIPSIAVLPLENKSGDPDQVFFADGMTDDITINLAKRPGILVIDRESTFSFRDPGGDLGKVAATLGVRYLLRGSVRRDEHRVRINATLIEMPGGQLVWAESYDRELTDVLPLQAEIAGRIAAALSDSIAVSEGADESNIDTGDLQAYDLFLRGRERFLRFSRDDTFTARRYFERALDRDAGFSNAFAYLSWTYAFEYTNGWTEDADDTLDRALALSEQAIALNDRLPVAHFVKALVHRERHEIALAMAESHKAIGINPSYANAYVMLATLLYYDGQAAEGLAMIEKAETINPLHPSNYPFHKGQALFILGRYDEAITVLEKGLNQNPQSQRLRVWLAASFVATGRQEDAEWEADQILLDDPDFRMDRLHHVFPFADPEDYERFRTALASVGFEGRM